jgi:hypothetical protein
MKRPFDEMAGSEPQETLETQQSDYKTKSAEVERELRAELHGAVFVNTPGFFDKFFDVPPSVVDRISTEICTQGYHDGSRWAAFPNKKDFLEKDLYGPFVDAANFITGQCSSDAKDIRWLTDANRSPVSDDTKAADVEPDMGRGRQNCYGF